MRDSIARAPVGEKYRRTVLDGKRDLMQLSPAFERDAGWSSLVARRAHNPEVVGSNPTPATKIRL